MKFCYSIFYFIFTFALASETDLVGEYKAFDEWQSEYTIILKEDGSAFSDYADGDNGIWHIVDGNIQIDWESGKNDYIFNGVMGLQRLHKSKNNSYTSGISKKLPD